MKRIPTGLNAQIDHIVMGFEIQFLNPNNTDLDFVALTVHDCDGCMTLNIALFGVSLYIGWVKRRGMDLLRDRLREIQERKL